MPDTIKVSKAEQTRIWLRECISFVLGYSNQKPEHIEAFIDTRSRREELIDIRGIHPIVNTKYTKSELIQFFCNLEPQQRKRLLEKFKYPQMVVGIPFDCKTFRIDPRPGAISYRYGNFAGKTVEYPVYSLIDVWEKIAEKEVIAIQAYD